MIIILTNNIYTGMDHTASAFNSASKN